MKREKWLDAIKGISCLIVFFNHFYLTFFYNSAVVNKILDIPPLRILVNGKFAVCLFLMISAYVICIPVYQKNDLGQIRKTAFKRYFRLALPVFFASLLSLILSHTVGYYNSQVGELTDNSWPLKYFTQDLTISGLIKSSFMGVLWQGDGTFNGPFWMLGIMFTGTFFVLIIAIITSGEKTKSTYVFAVLGFLLLVYLNVNVYFGCFILGTFLAYLRCRTDFFEKWKQKKCCTFISIMLLIASLLIPAEKGKLIEFFQKFEGLPAFFSDKIFFYQIAGFMLLFALMGMTKIREFLNENKLLNWISQISFSVYLLHWPIICSFSCWFYMLLKDNMTRTIKVVLCVLTIAIVIAASKIFYELAEKRLCTKITNAICSRYLGSESRQNEIKS